MDGAGQNDRGACDPLAFYVGRVERSFEPTAKSVATDLGPNLDRGAKVVTSATKELRWNWGTGLLSVNAPASQGATGFLAKAGTVTLGDVAISSSLEYGTVWVVALDGQPLKISKRILVQAFSEEQMYGFAAKDGRITDIGQSPINVRDISGTVTLPGKLNGQICNGHGYAIGAAETKQVGTTTVLTLPKDQLYTVLTR
jgi:hypothetical protein